MHRYFVPEMDRRSGCMTMETNNANLDGLAFFFREIPGGPGQTAS
jgi:hypothetical protein